MLSKSKEPPIIISIGGALISPPTGIDVEFLQNLNEFIRRHVAKGRRFFLTAGGGRIARHYRDAGKSVIGSLSNEDLDWLGIHATRLNGHLLRTIFQDIAHPRIIENYDKKLNDWKEPVVIGAGWKPGWSTDYDAVILARDYKANMIINMSNIDWVYDKDPKKFPDAKPIKKMTWEDMSELVGTEWSPGINAPFDPVAAQLAKSLELTVIVTSGNFKNMENILENEAFKGTVIMPFRIDAGFYDRDYYVGGKGRSRMFTKPESFVGRWVQRIANYYRAMLIKLYFNPKTVLDIGAGTGKLVKALRKFGIEAYGIDLSDDALSLAQPHVRQHLKKGDMTHLPYDDNQFDLVITFDVLEHLERSKIRKAVDESIRVSKKYIMHKIYTKENTWIDLTHGKDYSHISVLDSKFWKKLFLENPTAILQRNSVFKLPSFFESVFLLKKK